MKTFAFLIIMLVIANIESRNTKYLKRAYIPILAQLEQASNIKETSGISAFCFINSNGIIYDMFPTYNERFDYNVTLNNNRSVQGTLNSKSNNSEQLLFNVCGQAVTSCGNNSNYATYINNGECQSLTGNEDKFSNWSILFNNVTNQTTLVNRLPLGEVCQSNKSLNYSLTYEIACDANATNLVFDTSSFSMKQCSNKFYFSMP
jgi:hypothetical protein